MWFKIHDCFRKQSSWSLLAELKSSAYLVIQQEQKYFSFADKARTSAHLWRWNTQFWRCRIQFIYLFIFPTSRSKVCIQKKTTELFWQLTVLELINCLLAFLKTSRCFLPGRNALFLFFIKIYKRKEVS